MLYRLLIIVLLVLAKMPVEAATLKGVILANELSGSPSENVAVDAISGTNLTVSDLSGKFTLEFPQRRIGDTVRIIVKKEGYVVVNDVQLETVLPADADAAPLTIILCKQADREEMARRFYRLKSFDVIEETYQRKVRELEKAHQADATALASLQKERDQAKAAAEKASEELAKNPPGQNTELYQQTKRLFVEGKIEEAIQLLDEEKLRQLDEDAKKAVENAVQPRLLKAQLLTVQLRFKDAEKAYLRAIEIAPNSFESNFSYASFSQSLNRYEEARAAYGRCLEWARKNEKDAELALTLNNLGNVNRDDNRPAEARNALEEALKIRRELAQKDPETYLGEIAGTLINLGILDRRQNRLGEARKDFEEALKTYRELAQKAPETYMPYVAIALTNRGNVDHGPDEARKNYEEALEIQCQLAQKKPETYLPAMALTLNNLGVLDRAQNRPDEARKRFEGALKIRRELAQKNPEAYQPDVAQTLSNLGMLDSQNRPEEARKELEEALKIRRELAQKNPEAYQPNVAYTLSNLGMLDRSQNRPQEARQEFEEALQIYEAFAKQDPRQFSPNVARVKQLLAELPNNHGP